MRFAPNNPAVFRFEERRVAAPPQQGPGRDVASTQQSKIPRIPSIPPTSNDVVAPLTTSNRANAANAGDAGKRTSIPVYIQILGRYMLERRGVRRIRHDVCSAARTGQKTEYERFDVDPTERGDRKALDAMATHACAFAEGTAGLPRWLAMSSSLRATLRRPIFQRILFYGGTLAAIAGFGAYCSCMPGSNRAALNGERAVGAGTATTGTPTVTGAATSADELRRSVTMLATTIGPRSTEAPRGLEQAAAWLTTELRNSGYEVEEERFLAGSPPQEVRNLSATRTGSVPSLPMIVVGAHYDAVSTMPGADDNASGTAAALLLARRFSNRAPTRTVRFMFFTNEEPPHFQTETMGSRIAADRAKARGDKIAVMLSLETLGFYSDVEGSQSVPGALALLYPSRGNFVAFVGSLAARTEVRDLVGRFRDTGRLPAEGAALPTMIPGVMYSDHESYERAGYPAVMVTDTAFDRNKNYHEKTDLPATLDYARFASAVEGLDEVLVARSSE